MKNLKLLILLLALSITFTGCNNIESNPKETEQVETTTETEKVKEEETSEEEVSEKEESEISEETEKADSESFTGEYIISVDDFKDKISDPNIIIIDARGDDGAKGGFVEGARVIAWGQLADVDDKKPGEEGWGHILEPEQANPILSDFGLDPEKEIILYSNTNQGWGEDGRILWQLKAYGYDNLKMVDGGIDAIKEAGIDLVKDKKDIEKAEVNITDINYDAIIDTKQLSEAYDNYKIIDVRNKDEYEGATLYGEAKGGHLPGAVNIQYIDLFNEDGHLKSNDEIEKLFADEGFEKSDAIVTYCTGGIRSAYMQLVLEMLGYDNVMNYQGSYYNWAASHDVE